jgi:hypothetical protein
MTELLSSVIYKGAIVSQRDEDADDLFLDHIDDLLGLGLARHSSKSFDVANLLRRLVDDDDDDDRSQSFPSLAWIHVQEAAHSNQETRSKGNGSSSWRRRTSTSLRHLLKRAQICRRASGRESLGVSLRS